VSDLLPEFLPALERSHGDLRALLGAQDVLRKDGPLHDRLADLDACVVSDQEHAVERDLGASLHPHVGKDVLLVPLHAVLEPLCLYDGITRLAHPSIPFRSGPAAAGLSARTAS